MAQYEVIRLKTGLRVELCSTLNEAIESAKYLKKENREAFGVTEIKYLWDTEAGVNKNA